jgi:flagellar motor switch protein FliN/FliY
MLDHLTDLDRLDAFLDLSIPIEVRIGQTVMTLSELLAVDAGTLITLDKPAGEALDVLVGDVRFASAEVVVIEGSIGVRVTRFISNVFYPRSASLSIAETASA